MNNTGLKISKEVVKIIKNNGVGVLPTDTLYGLVGLAFSQKAVKRIYELKSRQPEKQVIVLISNIKDLKKFGVRIGQKDKIFLKQLWPNPISVVLPLSHDEEISQKIKHLTFSSDNLAFRIPKSCWLRRLLKKTGPLVAPSANPEGFPPATTIEEAKKYFNDRADFYVDGYRLENKPSTLIKISENGIEILRQGVFEIKK